MNDEIKKILFDLIEYYNVIGTEKDPGFEPFADVVGRASKALEAAATNEKAFDDCRSGSADIDPFAMDVVGSRKLKHESDLY